MVLGKGEQGGLGQVTDVIYWKGCQTVQIIIFFIFRLIQYRVFLVPQCLVKPSLQPAVTVGEGPSFAKGTKLSRAVSVAMVSVLQEHQKTEGARVV